MFRRKPKEPVQPEWLIVGLGNPGGEYDGTRHNVGFEVIRVLSERNNLQLDTRRLQSHYGVGTIGDKAVCLAKPMTYMNRSGYSASTLLRHFNLPVEKLIVAYDDMDLDVGRVHIRPKGGAGSHNGIKSLLEFLGTKDFPRVRIGIGSPAYAGLEHVLSRFERDEIHVIRDAIQKAAEGCELIVRDGIDITMNRVNG